MSNSQGQVVNEVAQKVALIATEAVNFPYSVSSSIGETTVWEVFADDKLYERAIKERFGPNADFIKVGINRYREMGKELGMDHELSRAIYEIKYERDDKVHFKSTIMVDVGWSLENDAFVVPDEAIPELDDPGNWPKWKRKIPVIVTMLRKCYEIAEEINKKFDVNLLVKRSDYPEGSDDYIFHTTFDASDMREEQFLKQIEKHSKAMVEAYRRYATWIHGSEYKKMMDDPRRINRIERRWRRMGK